MKKILLIAFVFITAFATAQTSVLPRTGNPVSVVGVADSAAMLAKYRDTLTAHNTRIGAVTVSDALKATIASPTFTGTVTIPTPFTLGATSVTSTGTQLNYLNAATGTTGSTNLVFSTSPTITTPTVNTKLTLTGATETGSSNPVLDITQTWNNAATTFTGIKSNITNTNSASGSLLLDMQLGGTSFFNVRKDGFTNIGNPAGLHFVFNPASNTMQFLNNASISALTFQAGNISFSTSAFGVGQSAENSSGIALTKNSTITSGTESGYKYTSSFTAAAGSAAYRPINLAYTINNSGAQSGTATGIFLNATETTLNSMTHNLMDLQVGGTSQLSVSNVGKLSIATGSNKSMGVSGAMTAGSITISTTAVTASSKIFLTHAGSNVTNAGVLYVGTITAGTSFVINSSNASDTDTVNWWIIN